MHDDSGLGLDSRLCCSCMACGIGERASLRSEVQNEFGSGHQEVISAAKSASHHVSMTLVRIQSPVIHLLISKQQYPPHRYESLVLHCSGSGAGTNELYD